MRIVYDHVLMSMYCPQETWLLRTSTSSWRTPTGWEPTIRPAWAACRCLDDLYSPVLVVPINLDALLRLAAAGRGSVHCCHGRQKCTRPDIISWSHAAAEDPVTGDPSSSMTMARIPAGEHCVHLNLFFEHFHLLECEVHIGYEVPCLTFAACRTDHAYFLHLQNEFPTSF